MEAVKKNRCVVIAAGALANIDIIRKNTYYDDFIIAADAGYLRCDEASVKPDLIIGDFDSAETPENGIETIVLSPVKDFTDTEYCVNEAVRRGFHEILIIGGLGGRNDHSFANYIIAAKLKQQNVNVTIIDDNHKVYALKDEEHIVGGENLYVSVFAFGGECEVTLEGFFYPLENYKLSAFSALGVSNELVEPSGKITVSDGTALVMEVNKTLQ